jgi:broad specificity phosphatase PhoE
VSERTIILVRHGRSAHVHAGWIDHSGFLRWREAYDAAGIDARETPPRELQEMARQAGVVVASDTARAVESARLLAEGREVVLSPLLREFTLAPPNLRRLRLPLSAWALAYGVRLLFRPHEHITPAEHDRAREAAQWLAGLAEEHGRVVVVTHATFRSVLGKALENAGWRGHVPRGRPAHWSASVFTRGAP